MSERTATKEIPGFGGFYKINTNGLVWTCRMRGYNSSRKGLWRIMKGTLVGGYLKVGMTRDGKGKPYPVHRLVLKTFVGPQPLGMQARHIDSNPRNNQLSNLRWGTPTENQLDKRGTKNDSRGEGNPRAKLTWVEVREIRKLYSTGKFSLAALGRSYGVAYQNIGDIVTGKTWKEEL